MLRSSRLSGRRLIFKIDQYSPLPIEFTYLQDALSIRAHLTVNFIMRRPSGKQDAHQDHRYPAKQPFLQPEARQSMNVRSTTLARHGADSPNLIDTATTSPHSFPFETLGSGRQLPAQVAEWIHIPPCTLW